MHFLFINSVIFETGYYSIAEIDLKLMILLLLSVSVDIADVHSHTQLLLFKIISRLLMIPNQIKMLYR